MNKIKDTFVAKHRVGKLCADCGDEIGKDNGPPDGWQLEDGRTVCHACCVADTKRIVGATIRYANYGVYAAQKIKTKKYV